MNIRNVSDRDRQLCAEIDELRVDRDEWKDATVRANDRFRIAEATIAKLKTQEPVMYGIQFMDGCMAGYAYRGRNDAEQLSAHSHPNKVVPLYLAAGAQGHAREQIGPDDRREGLDAHHVYCRAVTEDV